MDLHAKQHTSYFSESVLLVYFADISKKFKSSTLWSQYSMLQMMLSINQDLDISDYKKLRVYLFLKRKSDGYQPRKSKTFSTDQINKFISEAPDNAYLLTKVACIIGIMGACRRQELYKMKVTDVKDMGSTALITIPDTKNKITRKFTITAEFLKWLRSTYIFGPHILRMLIFKLSKGKVHQPKSWIQQIWEYGKTDLADPDMYTGHCFRRTSATILIDAGGDITSLKRHGGWKSSTVAETYVDDLIKNKLDVADKILNAIGNPTIMPSSSRSETQKQTISK